MHFWRLIIAFSFPQAVRASAAAPYYLDDFTVGEERFQDGAAIANNPTLIAIQQVRGGAAGLMGIRPAELSRHPYLDCVVDAVSAQQTPE